MDILQQDRELLFETMDRYIYGAVVLKDINYAMQFVDESVHGTGMGDQGFYYTKDGLLDKFVTLEKEVDDQTKTDIKYENFEVHFFTKEYAIVHADIFITNTVVGEEPKVSSFMQMASAIKRDDEWKWVMITVAPLEITESSIEAHPYSFAEGVLAQIRAEHHFDMLELLNRSFSAGIICTYADRENFPLYFANDALIAMLGYEREEFEQKFAHETMSINHPYDRTFMDEYSTIIAEQGVEQATRIRWIKKDGSLLWVEFHAKETRSSDNQRLLISIVVDITKIVDLQHQTEKQNKTIISSVRYARKIQKNMLPDEKLFKDAFSDYCTYWKPRELVGGDIYWLKTFSSGSVLCVVDCTGHGVPGALLTTMAIATIESIVKEHNCNDTASMLHLIDKKICKLLGNDQQGGINDLRDGCDTAILFIANDGTVSFSSGNIPMFHCDGETVERIRGQRLYIGEGKTTLADINTVTISPKEGDKFYLCTDGVYDQIGEKTGKPFGYKMVSDMILKYHHESLDNLAERLNQEFLEFMGSEVKRDDTTFIAFSPKISL